MNAYADRKTKKREKKETEKRIRRIIIEDEKLPKQMKQKGNGTNQFNQITALKGSDKMSPINTRILGNNLQRDGKYNFGIN